MGDIQKAEVAVKTEAVSVWAKIVAYLKAHIPHGLIGAGSYLTGKLGLIGALVAKFY